MSNLIGHIEPMVSGGNFRAYEDRVRQFIKVNKIKDDALTPLFITIVGAEVQELLMSLTVPDLPSSKKFEELMDLLREHFAPKANKRAERYKFNRAKQEDGESIKEFIIRLKTLAQTCEFGDFIPSSEPAAIQTYKTKILDEALCDKFIIGLRNEKVQQSLLNENNLSFEEYVKKALNIELSQKTSQSAWSVSTSNLSV